MSNKDREISNLKRELERKNSEIRRLNDEIEMHKKDHDSLLDNLDDILAQADRANRFGRLRINPESESFPRLLMWVQVM